MGISEGPRRIDTVSSFTLRVNINTSDTTHGISLEIDPSIRVSGTASITEFKT